MTPRPALLRPNGILFFGKLPKGTRLIPRGHIVQLAGGVDGHNNLMPFVTVTLWKRTA